MANAYKYWYGGKPSGLLPVGTSYVNLDSSKYDPGIAGWDNHLVYLNVKSAVGTGYLRVRAMRENGDATGYHDYEIKDGVNRLITHPYWENRGSNDGWTRWQLKCHAGLQYVEIDTRYTKRSVVRK